MAQDWVTQWGPELAPTWALDGDGRDSGGGDGDAAFDNSARVPEAEQIVGALAADSAAFREALGARARLGLPYGAHPREKLDLFLPEKGPVGLMVYVHGGYWRMRDRSDWSALAQGALMRGVAVAMPSYPLAPEVGLPRITQAVAQAIAFAADAVDGPIWLCGHSAGGHLAARMACADSPLRQDVAARLARVTCISGLHDLRPFLRAARMNADLKLDAETAASESPALHACRPGLPVLACVGGKERSELIRQSRLLAAAWTPGAAPLILPEHDHFTIVQDLAGTNSLLLAHILGGQDCDMTLNVS